MTRQQQWAQGAYARVVAVTDGQKKKYATRCMKMPSLLLQSGLAQGTSFLQSRGEDETTQYLNDFAAVLAEPRAGTGQGLAEIARTADLAKYLRLSRDALEVATWFRRFAQSELKTEDVE